jgi:hypothetical protein
VCVQSKVQWIIRIPKGATLALGTERTSTSERPSSRAFVDFPFFSVPFFSFSYFAPSSSPRVQQQKRPSSSRHKMTHSYQPQSLPPSPLLCLHISLLFNLLVSRSRTTLTDTKPLSCASRMLLHLSRLVLPFSYALTSTLFKLPSLAPPRSPLLYNIELADKAARMYIR